MENGDSRVRMEVDRLSSLPDEIIHHILSFNDTKYAVQTSVLSSRWKLIWKTLPHLVFSAEQFRILPKFSKFVNRVLTLRNNRAEVSSIDLYLRGSAKQKFMHKIANYVACRNLQRVNIYACNPGPREEIAFPLCFFNSQTLKSLRLKCPGRRFPLPQSPWDARVLTTVELNDVWLCPDNTVSLDLFSKCVNLMSLTLWNCQSNGLKLMKILCPQLVHLTISNCSPSNYELLAPNLLSFYYDGLDPLIISTGGLDSLEKVTLRQRIRTSIPNKEEMQRKAHEYMDMLHEFHNASFVMLYAPVVEFFSEVLDILEHQPSPFCNLKCLDIEDVKTQQKQAGSDLTSQVINYLLSRSPTATVNMVVPKVKLNGRMYFSGGGPALEYSVPKPSNYQIFATLSAEYEAKIDARKMSMKADFTKSFEAKLAENIRILEAHRAEYTRQFETQIHRLFEGQQDENQRRIEAHQASLMGLEAQHAEIVRVLEAHKVDAFRVLDENIEAIKREILQDLRAYCGIAPQPI